MSANLKGEQLFQLAAERPRIRRFRRMDEEERGFLANQEIVVLGDDPEIAVVCAGRRAGG